MIKLNKKIILDELYKHMNIIDDRYYSYNIRLKGHGDQIELFSIDEYTSFQSFISYRGSPFEMVVSKSAFKNALSICDKFLTMDISDKSCIIKSNYNEIVLSILPLSSVKKFDLNSSIKAIVELNAESLDALKKATLFVSTDEMKESINGIYLELEPSKLEIISTDAFILLVEIFEIFSTKNISIILRTNGINCIENNFDKLIIYDHYFQLKSPKETLTGTIIKGEYPNYKSAIPEISDRKAKIQFFKEDFMRSLEIIKELRVTSYITLNIRDNEMYLEWNDSMDNNFYKIKIPSKMFGDALHFSLSFTYLKKCILSLDGEMISMSVIDRKSNILVTTNGQTRVICRPN